MLKGLKEGLDYKVRVVAKGHSDQTVHHSEEILIKVPGEAGSQSRPRGLQGNVLL